MPQLNYKKILMVIGFVVITIGLVWLVWRLFFYRGPTPEEIRQRIIEENISKFPEAGQRQISRTFPQIPELTEEEIRQRRLQDTAQGGEVKTLPVTQDKVLDPVPVPGAEAVVAYDPDEGYFYKITEDGEKILMTDDRFYKVRAVTWSKGGDRAIIEYPDGSNILYDFTKRKAVTLPKEIVQPEFTPSEAIVAKTESDDPDKNWLIYMEKDGTVKFVEDLGRYGSRVQTEVSPNELFIALHYKPLGIDKAEVFFLGKNKENFKSFVVDGFSFRGRFSPDGTRLLYSVLREQEGYRPSLWVVSASEATIGQNKKRLNIDTWVHKCTFSENNPRFIYCGVPEELPENIGLLPAGYSQTKDVFYRVDLSTGISKLIAIPADENGRMAVSVVDIWLDKDEEGLYFWDAYTGKVFKIRLR